MMSNQQLVSFLAGNTNRRS